jgi:hypothetical protein
MRDNVKISLSITVGLLSIVITILTSLLVVVFKTGKNFERIDQLEKCNFQERVAKLEEKICILNDLNLRLLRIEERLMGAHKAYSSLSGEIRDILENKNVILRDMNIKYLNPSPPKDVSVIDFED